MSDFLSPGSKVTEVKKGPVILPGIATAIGGFVVTAQKGPVGKALLVTGPGDAAEVFGGYSGTVTMPDVIKSFFDNDGSACYLVRALGASNASATRTLANAGGSPANVATLTASSPGAWANLGAATKVTRNNTTVTTLAGTVSAGTVSQLTLASTARLAVGDTISVTKTSDTQRAVITQIVGPTVYLSAAITVPSGGYTTSNSVVLETWDMVVYDQAATVIASYRTLRMSALAGQNYYVNRITASPRAPLTAADLGVAPSATVDNRPATDAASVNMAGGADGSALGDADWTGTSGAKTGIYAFDQAADVNMISVPGQTSVTILKALEAYGDSRGDVVVIPDPPQGVPALNTGGVQDFVVNTANLASSYEALYWPWLKRNDVNTGVLTSYPPSPVVQGIIARVHKLVNIGHAPAGTVYAKVKNFLDLDTRILEGSAEYDGIYPYGINAFLNIPGEGICIFGSRTLDPTGEFGQISVRILFNIAKRVVKARTRFVNFENNNPDTRATVVRLLTGFFSEWRKSKILKGDNDAAAFFIQCDEKNNTPLVERSGKMKIRIGLAPQFPTEFLEITLEQDTRALDASLSAISS